MKKAARQTVEEIQTQVDSGDRLMATWPEDFFAAMDKHRRFPKSRGVAQLLNEAFPRLAKVLRAMPDRGWRKRLAAALGEYVERSHSTPWPLLARNPFLSGRASGLVEIASGLKVGFPTVRAAVDGGQVPVSGTRATEQGRKRHVLSTRAVSALAEALTDSIGVKTAGRVLGLTAGRVQALTASGVLGRTKRGVSRKGAVGLLDGLKAVAQEKRTSELKYSSLDDVLLRVIPVRNTASFLSAILDRSIRMVRVRKGNGIRSLRVAEADVQKWLRELKEGPGTSLRIPELAQMLGEKQEVIYDLVNAGLLKAERVHAGRRAARVVTRSALSEFEGSYIALNVLAKEHGIPAKHALRWALHTDTHVVTGPAIDGRRKYFVRRRGASGMRRSGLSDRSGGTVA